MDAPQAGMMFPYLLLPVTNSEALHALTKVCLPSRGRGRKGVASSNTLKAWSR